MYKTEMNRTVSRRELLEQLKRTKTIISVLETNLNNKSFVKGVNTNELSRLLVLLDVASSELARANVETTTLVQKYEKLFF